MSPLRFGWASNALFSILVICAMLGWRERSYEMISPVNMSLIGLRQHLPHEKLNWLTSVVRLEQAVFLYGTPKEVILKV